MSNVRRPALPMPNKSEVLELVTFLAANVAVAKEDDLPHKAERYQAMLDTVNALSERAVDLSAISRVVVVTNHAAARVEIREYDRAGLYSDGCVIDVQEDGRTLKLFPTPRPGTFI